MYHLHTLMYIYIEKSENLDFKDLAEVLEKLIFNNLHNHPPTKYFDTVINPLYSNNCSIWYWWKTVEIYKIAKLYIKYVVYSPFLALSV